ncbi:hypothetical protein [Faucicola atlantae]|uniref:Uncharacterized protein n=1 Tax=Faucicola atlantae TaxID=34059 RepID=A0A1B8QJK6_9GAMM|nr:hypothetical protein [Moraxella atlantae]OBX83668.1 hypothetical protein A9306_05245 [Moraxella atlantae]
MNQIVPWEHRTKTIQQLIQELQSFADQNLLVVVTDDAGVTFHTVNFHTVKLVSKGFVPCENNPNADKIVYCALHI